LLLFGFPDRGKLFKRTGDQGVFGKLVKYEAGEYEWCETDDQPVSKQLLGDGFFYPLMFTVKYFG